MTLPIKSKGGFLVQERNVDNLKQMLSDQAGHMNHIYSEACKSLSSVDSLVTHKGGDSFSIKRSTLPKS